MKTFTDARGDINDFGDGTLVITCNTGAKRANHFHKKSGHRSILVTGAMEYYEKPTGSDEKPSKQVLKAPAIFDTFSQVDHLMFFTEPSTFVCLRIGGSITPEEYETDLVRLDYDMKDLYDNWDKPDLGNFDK